MKRQTLTFAAILMGGLALTVSCTKENLFNLPEGAVMLTSESHVSTDKTSVSGTTVQWVGDGSESVTINDNPYTVHVSEGTAYIKPGEDGTPTLSVPLYGYYGCSEVTNPSTTTPTVTVPGTYDCSYDGNGRQILALPMVAYSSTLGSTIQFKQVTSAVKVMVRNEFNGVALALDSVVVSSNNYKLSGTVQVTLADNGRDPTVASQTIASGTSSVKVNLGGATIAYNNVREVQVPILPIVGNTNPNITIKAYAHDNSNYGHTYTYTNEITNASDLRLERNQMLTAKCRMSSETGHVDDFDARATALTFEAIIANTKVRFTAASGLPINMDYSIDNGRTWNTYTSGTDITLATVGEKVLFRGHGTNTSLAQSLSVYSEFSISPYSGTRCYVYGNIMSLLYETNYSTATTLPDSWTFCSLFDGSGICLHPTKTLLLPATTLTQNCYRNMFRNSTITTAPELPATILSESCYRSMFLGCSSLTSAPALPATTLAKYCYDHLFYGCPRLTSAPELPATTLANCDYCYEYMFAQCTSLVSAPALPATTLSRSCYECMFYGCTSLTSAPALPALTAEQLCYRCMFYVCTSLRSAPALPATTLSSSCYASMFSGCTSLTVAPPSLPATTLSNYCYEDMFRGCTSLTTAPALPATTMKRNCYYQMFYNCTSLNNVTCLATDINASSCTSDWLFNVAATGIFTKASSMSNWSQNADGIPSDWDVKDYVP